MRSGTLQKSKVRGTNLGVAASIRLRLPPERFETPRGWDQFSQTELPEKLAAANSAAGAGHAAGTGSASGSCRRGRPQPGAAIYIIMHYYISSYHIIYIYIYICIINYIYIYIYTYIPLYITQLQGCQGPVECYTGVLQTLQTDSQARQHGIRAVLASCGDAPTSRADRFSDVRHPHPGKTSGCLSRRALARRHPELGSRPSGGAELEAGTERVRGAGVTVVSATSTSVCSMSICPLSWESSAEARLFEYRGTLQAHETECILRGPEGP